MGGVNNGATSHQLNVNACCDATALAAIPIFIPHRFGFGFVEAAAEAAGWHAGPPCRKLPEFHCSELAICLNTPTYQHELVPTVPCPTLQPTPHLCLIDR